MYVYDVISYFNYIYAWAYLTGLRGTKIMDFISYTLVKYPDGKDGWKTAMDSEAGPSNAASAPRGNDDHFFSSHFPLNFV
jgi:hypothetical protein